MARLLIVRTGEPPHQVATRYGYFEDWFAKETGFSPQYLSVVDVERGEALPATSAFEGIIVTGSSSMVTQRLDWSERAAAWLRRAVDAGVSVLGVCYGHQLLAHALGGEVTRNPRGRQMGTRMVTRDDAATEDPLLGALPSRLIVQVSHSEIVARLPATSRLLATTGHDPHHAFAFGEHAWGIQFHPEFTAAVMRGYIESRRAILSAEGLDADVLLKEVVESTHGSQLLRRFAELIGC